ncbi:MAG: protein kinase [Acidobacteriia bacterium]|nr:protein kinase [Terriglobia bacterium]
MNPERWQQVEAVYHAARHRTPKERGAFLDGACRDDSDLRRRVESLLAGEAAGNGSPDSATFTVAAAGSRDPGGLTGGSWLGPYQIETPLGAGGMGQVYRARDTRLSRSVAVKVLSAGSVDRFIQEARAASALNHPNIVTIYDVGDARGVSYIVMELIEGQTLRQAMAGGPLPVPKLLGFAVQIADALATAHAKGIMHRDLKPANIMISAEGRAKILDFGLAKLVAEGGERSASAAEHPLTQPGTVLGTFGYMSPEQARGEPGDFRSDQFSFGAVLYEMATGRRAFAGSTQVDALAAVIRDQPEPIGRINPQAPAPLQWAVERCLAKSARDRYSSTQDLFNELSAILSSISQPVAAPAATPHNLPAQRTALVGRDQELEGARQLILQPQVRLLTMTGPGGIGKTRLAVELGRRLLDEFPGGVYFVPLDRISDADLVSSEIANALSVRQTGDRAIAVALQEHVRASTAPTLLLLDNFEHVLAASPLVTELLSASDQLTIVVTSRAALRLYGEYEFPVPPLDLPDRKTAPVELLAKSPAVALFLERATALRAGGAGLDEAQIRTVAEICARLDGLPLSIELAAARTRVLPLAALLERVRDPLQLLAGGPRDLPMRQRALRATLDWSHNLLDPEQQKLFRRMSVFVGGATHEAIEAVCNAKEDLNIDLLDAIESLVDNSLVRRTGADLTEPRFVMLETMREYGLGRLAEAGEEAYTRKAHAAYYVVLAEEAEPALMGGARQQEWFVRLDAEIGNTRAAMDWLSAAGEAEWGLRLGSALGFYWGDRSLSQEMHERFQKLLELSRASGRTTLRAKALAAAGDLAQIAGRDHDRMRHYEESLEIVEALGDPLGLLRAVTHSAVIERGLGRYGTARVQFERAAEIARTLGDPASLAGALSNLADIVKLQGEYELARLLQLETSRLFEQVGNRIGVAWSLSHQADLVREQGDAEKARALYEQALVRFRALESQPGIASCLHDLANLAAEAGDHTVARRLYGESLKLYWDLGHRTDLPRLLESFAACASAAGEPERALTLAGGAAALRKELDRPLTEAPKTRLESALEAARKRLSSAEATASWMRGWTMEPEAAVRFALGVGEPA